VQQLDGGADQHHDAHRLQALRLPHRVQQGSSPSTASEPPYPNPEPPPPPPPLAPDPASTAPLSASLLQLPARSVSTMTTTLHVHGAPGGPASRRSLS